MRGRRGRDRRLEAVVRAALGPSGGMPPPPVSPKRPPKTALEKRLDALREEARREQLVRRCRMYALPDPVFEFRFHATRRWRLDMAWPPQLVAGEIEGGVWIGGRHTRGKGFLADVEKYNALAAAGWRLVRGTPGQVKDGTFFRSLAEVLHV